LKIHGRDYTIPLSTVVAKRKNVAKSMSEKESFVENVPNVNH